MKMPEWGSAGRRCMAAAFLIGGVTMLSLAIAHGSGGDGSGGEGDDDEGPAPIVSLKRMKLPLPRNLGDYIEDRDAALQLGKALFWDVRVGSDNKTACASCHFHAGADNRLTNQVNPGVLAGDKSFQLGGAPNYTITAADFPFTRFADIDDPNSRFADLNDVLSSQGVPTRTYTQAGRRGAPDVCAAVSDAVSHGGTGFNINGVNTRRVEPRHTPSIFNSIFNFRNFWDGRGNNVFNGVDAFGLRNREAFIWKLEHGVLRKEAVALDLASVASQGDGPPLSENEMSCKNRLFAQVGRKLLGLTVLGAQQIHPEDSVLGKIAERRVSYEQLVRRAFKRAYWDSDRRIDLGLPEQEAMDLPGSKSAAPRARQRREGFTQMEANFSLFFGLALLSYQSTLVSDDAPFDRFAEGQRDALSAQQKRGLALFRSERVNCVHCHSGAAFTEATVENLRDEGRADARLGEGGLTFRYDTGFFNTGVRPTVEDPGVGGLDPFGNALSEARLMQMDRVDLLGPKFDIRNEDPVASDAPLAIAGAFKTPGLRNVELTGPYFHNGGKATLMQVIDFYNRGGDFGRDNGPITDPTIRPLQLTEAEKQDLVAFLLSLTDERVRHERAPFDRPSICVPDGHQGNTQALAVDANGDAVDVMRCVEAVGRRGNRVPLKRFLGLDPFAH